MQYDVFEDDSGNLHSNVVTDVGGVILEIWKDDYLPTMMKVFPLQGVFTGERYGVININDKPELTQTFGPLGESDPTGRSAHDAGAKLDRGKIRVGLVLGGFSRALMEVCEVGTGGAAKYSDNGWMEVPNGIGRYTDALGRHLLKEAGGELTDDDTDLHHAAHTAWNALARLELIIREEEESR